VRRWLACLAWLAAAATAGAQQGAYSISGTVVNALTGAPLDRAEVTASLVGGNNSQTAQVTTGEAGDFHFNNVPAGKYNLLASRRGYLSAGYQQHDPGYFTAIVTGPHLVSDGLRFTLMPYGTIGGTVNDDSGEPVGEARVKLFRQQLEDGETKIVSANNTTTDDAGGYEFSNLTPGTYYLDVMADPWYAVHSTPRSDLSGSGRPDEEVTSPLDVAYPMTFYPNAVDSASASPITVNAGDHAQANFSLHAVQAVHMVVRMPPSENSREAASTAFQARRAGQSATLEEDEFGSEQQVNSMLRVDSSSSQVVFDFGSVAPGHYQLLESGGKVIPIDLTSSRSVDGASAAAPTVDVSGKFAMALGMPVPEIGMAELALASNLNSRVSGHVNRDGSFDFPAVPAGVYQIVLNGTSTPLTVAAMAASGAEVHGNQLTVGSDSVLLAVTLAAGSTTINGFVQRDGKGVGGTMVLLVPADPAASTELVRRDQSDSDGSFTLGGVVSGDYIVVAIENGWDLEWARRDAIASYLAHGVKVQVRANQRIVNLPQPVAMQ
jgi:hypothetical protein